MYKTNKDVTSDKELSVLTDFMKKRSGLMAIRHSKAKEHKLAIERVIVEEKKDGRRSCSTNKSTV